MRFLIALVLTIVVVPRIRAAGAGPIRVLVWDERQPQQRAAYSNFLGNAIADHLAKQPGLVVTSVGLDSPEQGMGRGAIDEHDVVVWWGHVRQAEVKDAYAATILDRVKAGRLGLIALHSAHWSKPFVMAMQERSKIEARDLLPKTEIDAPLALVTPKPYTAPKRGDPLTPSLSRVTGGDGATTWQLTLPNCCFPAYRADGKPSHVKTLLPEHPIAKGLPAEWDIPSTEMYDEPFHVPRPDAVVFEETWDGGERFRSGSLWRVGRGYVFYFRPGHESYPIYTQALPLQVVENAVRWLGSLRH